MAIESLSFQILTNANLRDTSGGTSVDGSQKMLIVALTGATGTYETGGLEFAADLFGLSHINFLTANGTMLIHEEGHTIEAVHFVPTSTIGDDGLVTWKSVVMVNGEGGFGELPDDTELTIQPGLEPIFMLIGV